MKRNVILYKAKSVVRLKRDWRTVASCLLHLNGWIWLWLDLSSCQCLINIVIYEESTIEWMKDRQPDWDFFCCWVGMASDVFISVMRWRWGLSFWWSEAWSVVGQFPIPFALSQRPTTIQCEVDWSNAMIDTHDQNWINIPTSTTSDDEDDQRKNQKFRQIK